MPESKHDKYMRLYRKNKGDSYEAQEELEREEEEMDPKVKEAGEKIKKGVKSLKKQREAKRLVRGTPVVKGNKVVGQKGGVKNPNIEVQTDSYDPTAEFADRVIREAFDKMTKGELKDYDSKSKKPGSQPGHRRAATPEERKEMAAKFQKSRGGAGEKVKKLRDLRKP